MNGTPRLRSAFPSTPRNDEKDWTKTDASQQKRQNADTSAAVEGRKTGPLIPLNILDGPTQRFYVLAFYVGLIAWRTLDYIQLVSNDTESLWFFMKWVAIDGVCLYGIPGLRIPWLEWSSTTMTVLFLIHALIDAVLMFRIPIPVEALLVGLTKVFYDRELAVSERRVKPATLLHSSSLILGKQIVHILPEGSAMLNPEEIPLCISASRKPIFLPIFINQTNPKSLELLRIDLDTHQNETISISSKELKRLKKQADKVSGKMDFHGPRILNYQVKQTGLYRLSKVIDESNLEVHRKLSDALVVKCPTGFISAANHNKCKGELSDFYIQVDATPPLKVKYSKSVDKEDRSHVSLTVHPDNLESPLARQEISDTLVKIHTGQHDMTWAQTRRIKIPVNETLGFGNSWMYSLDEIHDGCGNVVNYTALQKTSRSISRDEEFQQSFTVHERPRAVLDGCSPQEPLKVARGRSRNLPIRFNPTGLHKTGNAHHHISYTFKPQAVAGKETEQALIKIENMILSSNEKGPEISEPGLYSLNTVSTEYCTGEVLEPSSCLLSNPPEPELTITSENIPHQCAGNSIGLRVNLDLIGTPPFEVSYYVHHKGGSKISKTETVNEMRTQMEFKPREAGHYIYEFVDIADAVYRNPRSIKQSGLRLEQDVKPTAMAIFASPSHSQKMCIQEPATFDLKLSGEAPWSLEFDLVHNGKRTKHTVEEILENHYVLVTPSLSEGGQYSLSLTRITDASGCRIHLKEEAKIDVRLQRPSVAFGLIEGQRSTSILENGRVDLPLRLSGEPPWTIAYRKTSTGDHLYRKRIEAANDVLVADSQDIYLLVEMSDRVCPGSVDNSASEFQVLYTPRPQIRISQSSTLEVFDDIFQKKAVCEGDQDYLEVLFSGHPPYHIKYDISIKPERGSALLKSKQDRFGLQSASIRMETSQAGLYEYRVTELGDQLYDHDRRSLPNFVLRQIVNGRPTASFVNPGKTYNYCKEEAVGDEVIPISLMGMPPFSMEISIKHHAASLPEVVNVPSIESHRYDFHIPHSALSLGLHTVSIRKVVDANGCQREMPSDGPSARVSVVDVPSISPIESNDDFCIGERISYTLAGTPPFNVYYTFEGVERKASAPSNTFRRVAEKPGNFTITAVSDKASSDSCRSRTNFTKIIHALPSVRISKGRTMELDIHEGGEAELLFEFGGTPPFEFTWTRSTNAAKGKKTQVLETRTDVSHEHSKSIKVTEEGTYEVVSIRDQYCEVSTQKKRNRTEQQLLTF